MSTPAGTALGASERLTLFGLWVLRKLAHLPYAWLRTLGNLLGDLAWWLAAPRRHIAMTNLRLCFPDRSEADHRRIAHAHFRMFMRGFLDRSILWYESPERIRHLVRLEGVEHFEAWQGKPIILLAPHFVGMDAGGIRLQLDWLAASMYANQKSKVLTEAMTRGRTRFNGARMFLRNDGLRPVVRAIRNGVVFYFLPDMDLGPRDAIFVPFFGVPAATVTSTARLASMTGAVVIPLVTELRHDGYVARFYPAWEGYPGEDVQAATRRMNAFIEERVLEMPEQYLWTHKRFKTRPPGEPSLYRRPDGS